MAKKKEINLRSTPATVESGDVNFSYNNVLVGSLSESGTAVLKTEMTICEHDIEVEYTKPAGESYFPTFNIEDNTTDGISSDALLNFTTLTKHQEIDGEKWISESPFSATHYVPSYDPRANGYTIVGNILSETDKYNVTINNIPVLYAPGLGYNMYGMARGYNTDVNIVISDKE